MKGRIALTVLFVLGLGAGVSSDEGSSNPEETIDYYPRERAWLLGESGAESRIEFLGWQTCPSEWLTSVTPPVSIIGSLTTNDTNNLRPDALVDGAVTTGATFGVAPSIYFDLGDRYRVDRVRIFASRAGVAIRSGSIFYSTYQGNDPSAIPEHTWIKSFSFNNPLVDGWSVYGGYNEVQLDIRDFSQNSQVLTVRGRYDLADFSPSDDTDSDSFLNSGKSVLLCSSPFDITVSSDRVDVVGTAPAMISANSGVSEVVLLRDPLANDPDSLQIPARVVRKFSTATYGYEYATFTVSGSGFEFQNTNTENTLAQLFDPSFNGIDASEKFRACLIQELEVDTAVASNGGPSNEFLISFPVDTGVISSLSNFVSETLDSASGFKFYQFFRVTDSLTDVTFLPTARFWRLIVDENELGGQSSYVFQEVSFSGLLAYDSTLADEDRTGHYMSFVRTTLDGNSTSDCEKAADSDNIYRLGTCEVEIPAAFSRGGYYQLCMKLSSNTGDYFVPYLRELLPDVDPLTDLLRVGAVYAIRPCSQSLVRGSVKTFRIDGEGLLSVEYPASNGRYDYIAFVPSTETCISPAEDNGELLGEDIFPIHYTEELGFHAYVTVEDVTVNSQYKMCYYHSLIQEESTGSLRTVQESPNWVVNTYPNDETVVASTDVGDQYTLVAGMSKIYTFTGDAVTCDDRVKFIQKDRYQTCWEGSPKYSDVFTVDQRGLAKIKVLEANVEGGPLTMCYQHANSDWIELETGYNVYDVFAYSALSGADDVAVVGVEKTWSLDGYGFSTDDTAIFVRYNLNDLPDPTEPLCLNGYTQFYGNDDEFDEAFGEFPAAYGFMYHSDSSVEVSANFEEHSDNTVLRMCYRFKDEPFKMLEDVTVMASEVDAVRARLFADQANHPSDLVSKLDTRSVRNVPKVFDVEISGIQFKESTPDEAYYVFSDAECSDETRFPVEIVRECTAPIRLEAGKTVAYAASSPFFSHVMVTDVLAVPVEDGLFRFRFNPQENSNIDDGAALKLCYVFGEEPAVAYDNHIMRVFGGVVGACQPPAVYDEEHGACINPVLDDLDLVNWGDRSLPAYDDSFAIFPANNNPPGADSHSPLLVVDTDQVIVFTGDGFEDSDDSADSGIGGSCDTYVGDFPTDYKPYTAFRSSWTSCTNNAAVVCPHHSGYSGSSNFVSSTHDGSLQTSKQFSNLLTDAKFVNPYIEHWLSYDLGQMVKVNAVTISSIFLSRPTSFRIQASTTLDGPWREVRVVSNDDILTLKNLKTERLPQEGNRPETSVISAYNFVGIARYWRIVFLASASSLSLDISEVQFYGIPAFTTEGDYTHYAMVTQGNCGDALIDAEGQLLSTDVFDTVNTPSTTVTKIDGCSSAIQVNFHENMMNFGNKTLDDLLDNDAYDCSDANICVAFANEPYKFYELPFHISHVGELLTSELAVRNRPKNVAFLWLQHGGRRRCYQVGAFRVHFQQPM